MALHPSSTPLLLKPRPERLLGQQRELSAEEMAEVRFAFECLDYEKAGSVTQKQLKVALRAMGFPCKKQDVLELLRRHGEDDCERLEWPSFLRAVTEKLSERSPMDDLKRAFRLFDLHGQGRINLATLRKVVREVQVGISDEELQDMIAEFDLDKDGMINEAEFMSIMAGADDTL